MSTRAVLRELIEQAERAAKMLDVFPDDLGTAINAARAALAADEKGESELVAALDEIANGRVPAGFLNGIETESRASFQERLAAWSQQRARDTLAKRAPKE